MQEVKQQQLLPVDFDEWRRKKENHQQNAGDIPRICQFPFWSLCKNPKSFAAFINGVKPVAKAAGRIILILHITYKARPAVLLGLEAWCL